MILCSCRAVCDRTVTATIASGAATLEEVAGRCGAGSGCGGCWPELQRLLDGRTGEAETDRTAAA